MDYLNLNLFEVSELLKQGKVSSEELTKQCLKQIERTWGLNALNEVYADLAVKRAKEIDV